ncbi:hypothetical protein [Streptomyces sp. NPDC001744]
MPEEPTISTTGDTDRVSGPDADEHQDDDQADVDTVARLLPMA